MGLPAPAAAPRSLVISLSVLGVLAVPASLTALGTWATGLSTVIGASVLTGIVATVCCLSAAMALTGVLRLAWLLIGLCMVLTAAGDQLWTIHGDESLTATMTMNGLYLAGVVAAGAALVLYPVLGDGNRLLRTLLLDAAVLAAAVVFVCHTLVVDPVLDASEDTVEIFLLSVYPVACALLASLIVLLLLRSEGLPRLDLVLGGLALAAYCVASSGYALRYIPGSDEIGRWVDVGYTVAPLIVAGAAAAAATLPTPRRTLRRHLPGVVSPLLPDLAALVALALAAVMRADSTVSILLGIITLLAVGGRQLAQTSEGEKLRGELERAVDTRTDELEELTEQYRRLDAMKYEFVTAVSHELRTPLAAIRGSLEMLYDGDAGELPRSAQSVLAIATRGSERLSRLVNDIIDLERLESGTFGFAPASQPVGALVTEATDSLHSLAVEQGVVLRVGAVEGDAWCDADRVVQVLVNLLGNALKFSPAGSTVSVEALRDEGEIVFSVVDQGRGIPEHELSQIFDRFHQVDMDDSRQQGGAGLGLTICRHIVERHQGRIWAESPDEKGTTFRFTLPVAAEVVASPAHTTVEDAPAASSGRVLARTGRS